MDRNKFAIANYNVKWWDFTKSVQVCSFQLCEALVRVRVFRNLQNNFNEKGAMASLAWPCIELIAKSKSEFIAKTPEKRHALTRRRNESMAQLQPKAQFDPCTLLFGLAREIGPL